MSVQFLVVVFKIIGNRFSGHEYNSIFLVDKNRANHCSGIERIAKQPMDIFIFMMKIFFCSANFFIMSQLTVCRLICVLFISKLIHERDTNRAINYFRSLKESSGERMEFCEMNREFEE